jgi:hypothetical protein
VNWVRRMWGVALRFGLSTSGLLLLAIPPAVAQGVCPPMTSDIAATHTHPPTGSELLHPHEAAFVRLKIVIRRDGTSDVGIERSSGITALNQRAMAWVRDHWLWPRGCAPGTTRRVRIMFVGW